jgi:hypothetical protein
MARCDADEELEVPVGVGADGDDVDAGAVSGVAPGVERVDVDAERDEHDRRPAGPEPVAEPGNLALRIRKDGARAPQRTAVEATRERAAQLDEPLGQSDRGVDDRPAHDPEVREEDQRDPDPVDGREDHVGLVRGAQRRKDRREVASVAAHRPDERPSDTVAEPCPRWRRPALEVVPDAHAPGFDVVEPEEPIALEGARRRGESRSPLGNTRIGEEDGGRGRAAHGRNRRERQLGLRRRPSGCDRGLLI